jgi:hypothetical protein
MSDVATYRMDQYEKRADAADARMARVEDLPTEIRVDLARKPTVAGLWGMVAATIGVSVAMVALFVPLILPWESMTRYRCQ